MKSAFLLFSLFLLTNVPSKLIAQDIGSEFSLKIESGDLVFSETHPKWGLVARDKSSYDFKWHYSRPRERHVISQWEDVLVKENVTYVLLYECHQSQEDPSSCSHRESSLLLINDQGQLTKVIPLQTAANNDVLISRIIEMKDGTLLLAGSHHYRKDDESDTLTYPRFVRFNPKTHEIAFSEHKHVVGRNALSDVKIIDTGEGYSFHYDHLDHLFMSYDGTIKSVNKGVDPEEFSFFNFFKYVNIHVVEDKSFWVSGHWVLHGTAMTTFRHYDAKGKLLGDNMIWEDGDTMTFPHFMTIDKMLFVISRRFIHSSRRQEILVQTMGSENLPAGGSVLDGIEYFHQIEQLGSRIYWTALRNGQSHLEEISSKNFKVLRTFVPPDSKLGYYRLSKDFEIKAFVPIQGPQSVGLRCGGTISSVQGGDLWYQWNCVN